jgi:hypothetical protein
MWIYTSTPPYAFMAQCLIKYRVKFTFILLFKNLIFICYIFNKVHYNDSINDWLHHKIDCICIKGIWILQLHRCKIAKDTFQNSVLAGITVYLSLLGVVVEDMPSWCSVLMSHHPSIGMCCSLSWKIFQAHTLDQAYLKQWTEGVMELFTFFNSMTRM